jgi:hypothetical protein
MRELRLRRRRGADRASAEREQEVQGGQRREGAGTRGEDEHAPRPPRPCGASGWQLRVGCTDGLDTAICPRCDQVVRTRLGTVGGDAVRVIKEHVA